MLRIDESEWNWLQNVFCPPTENLELKKTKNPRLRENEVEWNKNADSWEITPA